MVGLDRLKESDECPPETPNVPCGVPFFEGHREPIRDPAVATYTTYSLTRFGLA